MLRITWPTIHGKDILNESMTKFVQKGIKEACEIHNWELKELNVGSNFVSVLVNIPLSEPAEKVVKELKRYSSYYLSQEFPNLRKKLGAFWLKDFFVKTVAEGRE